MTDQQIIKAIASDDQNAFRILYAKFGEKVYNTALSYIQNEHDAEEITQDVFTNIFRNAAKFQGNSSLSTWIYRITVNASLNAIKSRKRTISAAFDSEIKNLSDFEHPGILLENKENASALFKVIDSLPESQKTAFILSYIEELPQQEVADIMDTSLKAVESLLQRSKANLREKLKNLFPHRRKR